MQDSDWTIDITAADRDGASTTVKAVVEDMKFTVRVDDAVADTLAPGVALTELVSESFRFLLERESVGAILQRFELPVIGQYFPEYSQEIRRRLSPR